MNKTIITFLLLLIGSISTKAQTEEVLIDFGNTIGPFPWNTISNPANGRIDALINNDGTTTGLGIEVFDEFNGNNGNGTQNPDPSLDMPSQVSSDSFFGNTVFFANDTQPTGGVRLFNLDPATSYTLTMFASRVASDNRETRYEIVGEGNEVLLLNVASNTANTVSATMRPATDGTLSITASPGPNNNNTFGFFYLGALKVSYQSAVANPSLSLLSPNGGESFEPGENVPVQWNSEQVSQVAVAFSEDNGSTWDALDTIPGNTGLYNWTVPNINASTCLIRITSDSLSDQSDAPFTVAPSTGDGPRTEVLIDFGNTTGPFPWNTIDDPANGHIEALMNSNGATTGLGITVFDEFNGNNGSGTQNPDTALNMPSQVTMDSFFGNTVLFDNDRQPTGGVRLFNLDPSAVYTLTIFASRVASDNRETRYEISGLSNAVRFLNVASNTANTVSVAMRPASDGTLSITASPGPNNNNTFGFFYLGALKVSYQDTGSNPSLSLISPNGGESFQPGAIVPVRWASQQVNQVAVAFSENNGSTWEALDTIPGGIGFYNWTVPNINASTCLIRINSDSLSDQSDAPFTVAPSTGGVCRIVVLGSSTAAGFGIPADSSWVNRYNQALQALPGQYEVENLARGGTGTFSIMPTGTVVPPAYSPFFSVDPARNITHALSLNPSLIIINMPSNDARYDVPAATQLANFETIANLASAQGIPTFVCTTQPRNFSSSTKVQLQRDTRDSIFTAFGDRAIDFWNGLAAPNGFILAQFNFGDGIHVNEAGHQLLFDRVWAAAPHQQCGAQALRNVQELQAQTAALYISPNPFVDEAYLTLNTQMDTEVSITITDMAGRNIGIVQKQLEGTGQHRIPITAGIDTSTRILVAHIIMKNAHGTTKHIARLVNAQTAK